MLNAYFQTPPVVKNLIMANCLMWLATEMLPIGNEIIGYLALFNAQSSFFHSFQVVSYMFLHGGLSHLFFNMFALWMFGRSLEERLGPQRFLTYYLVCGIGAGLLQLGVGWLEYSHAVSMFGPASSSARMLLQIPTVGASGAIFGLLLAYGVLYPNAIVMLLLPPIPIKAKWFVIIYALIELFFGMSGRQPGVAHFAHVGGMLWGLLLLWYWRKNRKIFF